MNYRRFVMVLLMLMIDAPSLVLVFFVGSIHLLFRGYEKTEAVLRERIEMLVASRKYYWRRLA